MAAKLFRSQKLNGYLDIHCHTQPAEGESAIVSLDTRQFAEMNSPPPGYTYSLGIHPWFILQQDLQTAFDTLERFASNEYCLAIGECGLDKTVSAPMAVQIDCFARQIELAERLGKPLVIHCVRAFNELLQIQKASRSTVAWIVHGFDKNTDIARQLLTQGCYLSFGKALLREGGNAARAIKITPPNRLFLETDAAQDTPISAIYAAAAKMTGLNLDALQRQILDNFERAFLHD